jgi:hypothetical protein
MFSPNPREITCIDLVPWRCDSRHHGAWRCYPLRSHKLALAGRARGPALTVRRFPPPWSVEEFEAYFVVTDSTGQKIAYVYFEDEPGRRSAAKLLTKDEARRICGEHRQAAGAVADGVSGGA